MRCPLKFSAAVGLTKHAFIPKFLKIASGIRDLESANTAIAHYKHVYNWGPLFMVGLSEATDSALYWVVPSFIELQWTCPARQEASPVACTDTEPPPFTMGAQCAVKSPSTTWSTQHQYMMMTSFYHQTRSRHTHNYSLRLGWDNCDYRQTTSVMGHRVHITNHTMVVTCQQKNISR